MGEAFMRRVRKNGGNGSGKSEQDNGRREMHRRIRDESEVLGFLKVGGEDVNKSKNKC